MNYIKRIRSRASKVPKNIILSEGTDDRVILAAIESVVEGFGEMTLIGPVDFISEKIKKFTSSFQQKKQNEILSKIKIINPEKSDLQEEFAREYLKCRAKKPITMHSASIATGTRIACGIAFTTPVTPMCARFIAARAPA